MNENQTLLEFISALPFSPPDPVGLILWHEANKNDLLVKGDGILKRMGEERSPEPSEPSEEEPEVSDVAISTPGPHSDPGRMMTPSERIISKL